MGYNATTRRTVNVSVHGNAYDERNLLGVAYTIEQATKAAANPGHGEPQHVPVPRRLSRRSRSPPVVTATRRTTRSMQMLGGRPVSLPFSLETETAAGLRARLLDGKISAVDLTKAYLYRIALTNAEGPPPRPSGASTRTC
jgi:hypothetical protein